MRDSNPILWIAGAAGGLWLLNRYTRPGRRAGDAATEPTAVPERTPTLRPPPPPAPVAQVGAGRWVFPVPAWSGRSAAISSGFGMRGDEMHLGVDIMFRRRTPSDLAERFPRKTANGSTMHCMPDAIPALALSEGVVRFAGNTPRGWTVIIDHAVGITSYWTHLSALLLREVKRGSHGPRVVAGQPLGLIGFDPKDPARLKHLHLELWQGGQRSRAFDPATWLHGLPVQVDPLAAIPAAPPPRVA